MKVLLLQSGSSGNCLYVETRHVAVLFDAGITAKQVALRLESNGYSLAKVQAVVVSHGHRDHIHHSGVYHRRLKLPVWVPRACQDWLAEREKFLPHAYCPGEMLTIGDLRIETIPTPHDFPDSVAFIVDDGRNRLGVFTDLGHAFADLEKHLSTVDALIIESNYDPVMLANGPYSPELQARIRGPGGHLSNIEAANCVKKWKHQYRWVCLAHLSQHNNTPEVAEKTFRKVVGRGTPYIAEYYSVTRLPAVE